MYALGTNEQVEKVMFLTPGQMKQAAVAVTSLFTGFFATLVRASTV
jgi:hypothetical protein